MNGRLELMGNCADVGLVASVKRGAMARDLSAQRVRIMDMTAWDMLRDPREI